ncbi:MAG: DNA-formamidopyrimidine glycosylase [Cyanobacteriota bacterium]|nr:DNA-formamidopyrimidine glycosylase [Cyanobacteriota bacterium]
MPELPEVETVRRDLERFTVGERVQSVQVLLARTLAFPERVDDLEGWLLGRQFLGWQRRGKYLLGILDQGIRLGVHLRMTGQLLWLASGVDVSKHTRLIMRMESGWQLHFVDQRTFGQIWGIPVDQPTEAIIPAWAKLGPEPFSPEFSLDYWSQQLRRRQASIKTVLLDQRLVAGVGNIYADESLFLSRIHPQSLACQLSPSQADTLHHQLIHVLREAVEQRGTTFRDYRDARGINGNYQGQAWVYGRAGDPCRVCQHPIERLKLAGRSAHFCPQCQPPPSRTTPTQPEDP